MTNPVGTIVKGSRQDQQHRRFSSSSPRVNCGGGGGGGGGGGSPPKSPSRRFHKEPRSRSPSFGSSPLSGVAADFFYAGFTEPPSPAALPKPPTHWVLTTQQPQAVVVA